ncbi:MAG TPA: dihydropteroate synthase [Actinomycetota bacterium]|nr:dihydropteroate synthase [Actinomycetota bacterium]
MSGRIWRCGDHAFDLDARTLVVGIVNVTPDSFSDGGMFDDAEAAVAHGIQLADEGADIVDIGGESTRPGAEPVTEEEERRRVLPVIEGLNVARPDLPISIDTRHAAIATDALAAGASVVNDVSGGADEEMLPVVANANAGLVLMHMRGEPPTMQEAPLYEDVVGEVHEYLRERVEAAIFAGVGADRLCVDPGIGFGKTVEHNLQLLRSIDALRDLDAAVMVGASRKRFEGSLAAAILAAASGADIVRVHDVLSTVRALRVADAITRGSA